MRYRVLLLLVVAVTAFSSAMKELNQLQQFALDASQLMAQLSEKVAPAPVPKTPEIQHPAITVETCEIKQSLPAVELPWLDQDKRPGAVVPRPSQIIEVTKVERPASRVKARDFDYEFAKLKKLPQIEIDPVAFEVTIPSDHDADAATVITSGSQNTFKTKTRRHDAVRINPRDGEVLLKTLNRSISLRIAS